MTRKLTPTRLDEIVAAAEDATPGPWEAPRIKRARRSP